MILTNKRGETVKNFMKQLAIDLNNKPKFCIMMCPNSDDVIVEDTYGSCFYVFKGAGKYINVGMYCAEVEGGISENGEFKEPSDKWVIDLSNKDSIRENLIGFKKRLNCGY